MEEGARITDEEMKAISTKKMDLEKKIKEMAGVRMLTEYDLRLEQCNLLEMSISALDAEEDRSALMEPVEQKIKSLEKKIEVLDSELGALKEKESNLAKELQDA